MEEKDIQKKEEITKKWNFSKGSVALDFSLYLGQPDNRNLKDFLECLEEAVEALKTEINK